MTQPQKIRLEPHAQFKKAIVGRSRDGRHIYCYEKLMEIFKEQNDWTDAEAAEWIDYNVLGLECMGLKIRYPKN